MIDFLSTFVSYLIVLLVFVVVGGIGIFLGITMRKRKDAQNAQNPYFEAAESEQKK